METWLKRDVLPASRAGTRREFDGLDRTPAAVDGVGPSRAGWSAGQTAAFPNLGETVLSLRSEPLKRTFVQAPLRLRRLHTEEHPRRRGDHRGAASGRHLSSVAVVLAGFPWRAWPATGRVNGRG